MREVSLRGRIGQQPELKRTQSGTAFMKFSVAVNEKAKDGNGYKSFWFNVAAFGMTAERLVGMIHKGTLVRVDGKLESSKYIDKNGANRESVEIIAWTVDVVHEAEKLTAPVDQPQGLTDDDIPF